MKIKMAMVGLALGGLVASSAAQVPPPRIEQDVHTSYTGPVESMGTAATSALVTKLLKTKKVQGALAAVAVEVVTAAAELLGGDVVERVDGPPTDVLFDVATR